MISESLLALASAGGASMAQAAGTDGWNAIRDRAARLMARGSHESDESERRRLDRTAAALTDSPDGGTAGSRAAAWQAGFVVLLTRLEGAELHAAVAELRALVDSGPIAASDDSAPFAGSTFHGPTAIQTGDNNHQDNHFGHSG
ncbi:hypothetical protein [Streptomyces sp. NPDC048669]|uniref:hypothetical protein n=1 Tax=Streptomyces sp. NPDC048669 TaxID=3155267 RepID=UPI00343E4C2E